MDACYSLSAFFPAVATLSSGLPLPFNSGQSSPRIRWVISFFHTAASELVDPCLRQDIKSPRWVTHCREREELSAYGKRTYMVAGAVSDTILSAQLLRSGDKTWLSHLAQVSAFLISSI